MPLPGHINSPVCWAYGNVQATGTNQVWHVATWMHPWQIPIGVMQTESTEEAEIQIQVSGEFRVSRSDVYPNSTWISDQTNLIGRRVYYDPYAGKYIVREACRIVGFDPRALFPGSATIGYISTIDEENEEVGITIDPRPPTATYEVGLASTGAQWNLGTPVIIDPETSVVSMCSPDSTSFTGVVAGWLKHFLVPPIGNTDMIVVTQGTAWYPPQSSVFYDDNSREELLNHSPSRVPVNITGEACLLGETDGETVIGNISLNEWYDGTTEHPFPDYVLLDVRRHIPNSEV